MFNIESDNTIHVTRGDVMYFGVTAKDEVTGEDLLFQPGDIVRIKVYAENKCENVVLEKDFLAETVTDEVYIYLDEKDTTIGKIINQSKNYWYEIILNPEVKEQTIIGYDDEGPKLFILYPEGAEIPKTDVDPGTIPVVDTELDPLSERPIANSAVALAVLSMVNEINQLRAEIEMLKGESE